MKKRILKITTVTTVEVETDGKWTMDEIIREIKIKPAVIGDSFSYVNGRSVWARKPILESYRVEEEK